MSGTSRSKQAAGSKRTTAASVVAQAKAKRQSNSNVTSLDLTRIERTTNDDGSTALWAIFPGRGASAASKIDLSFLLWFPKLTSLFSEAFLRYGSVTKPNTRSANAGTLKRYFFTYLRSGYESNLPPDALDDAVLIGFRQYLLTVTGKRGHRLTPSTVKCALSAVRSVLTSLSSGPLATTAQRIAERIPAGLVAAGRYSEPTEVLSLDVLMAIMAAAEKEVLAVSALLQEREALLEEGRHLISEGSTRYETLSICLAELDATWKGVIPDHDVILQVNPQLGKAVRYEHGLAKVTSYFYPSPRELVPFVLLLSIATVFNPDTLVGLRWADIDLNSERGGTRAIKIVGEKGRAAKSLVRLLDPDAGATSEISLLMLLEVLRHFTARILPLAPADHADQLFTYVIQVGKKRITSFRINQDNTSRSGWANGLRAFIRENNLPSFVLKQLRPSILDLVQLMGGSLEDARAVGDHRQPMTTWTYYTSSTVKKRYRERVGEVLLLRERWIVSQGKIDPRRMQQGDDKAAATPGFICLDPYDSPRPNQKLGKLCNDYGGCPGCPLAAARPNDPTAVSFYSALQVAIYKSQLGMAAHSWLNRWAPILADLNALLEHVPASVLAESRRINITLPKVG